MLAKLNSLSLFGLFAKPIKIEVDLRGGLPGFSIIGLPDTMVKESRDRVLSAIRNSGFKVPLQKIVVNLAPADIRKQGTIFDLPIALGILISSNQIDIPEVDDIIFAGELSLDGTLSSLKGALCISLNAKENNFRKLLIPKKNLSEANLIENINVIGAYDLLDTIDKIRNFNNNEVVKEKIENFIQEKMDSYNIDFSDVKGQMAVKRAIEVAVSGGHNVLMMGPPGSGKTMIARRVPTIIPPMTVDEIIETTMIYSIAGKLDKDFSLVYRRPFRSPHHTSSDIAIVGGGEIPKPGEVTLAHNGVLFMDEFPHFKKNVLQCLREPLEEGFITISRSSGTVTFPSNFMLIGAMNPCPCGYLTHPDIECKCSEASIKSYLSKIGGPLLDRIDIYIDVPKIDYADLIGKSNEETSEIIKNRVAKTREIQNERFKKSKTKANSSMTKSEIDNFCQLDNVCKKILTTATEKLKLSGRGFDRIIKISRTIADMDNSESLREEHILEALQYRKPLF